jgi:hypothetical protein
VSNKVTALQGSFILEHYNKPGWTTRKIAETLQIPRGTVISHYHALLGKRKAGKEYYYKEVLKEDKPERQQPSMPRLKFLGDY